MNTNLKRKRPTRIDIIDKESGRRALPEASTSSSTSKNLVSYEDGALPNDTYLSLQFLRSQFPRLEKVQVPPLILRNQLYSLLIDRTQADRDLDLLRRKNVVRMFKLPTGADDYAIVFTQDYVAKVDLASQIAARKSGAEAHEDAFNWFKEVLLPRCTELSIAQVELQQIFSSSMDPKQLPLQAGPGVLDSWVTVLVQAGFLTRKASSGAFAAGECHWFSIPSIGLLSKSLIEGKAEIARLLSQRKFNQILESLLEKHKMRSSLLGIKFHLRDMVGCQLIKSTPTTCGSLLTLL